MNYGRVRSRVVGWQRMPECLASTTVVEVMRRIVSKPDERGNGGEGGSRRRGPRIYHAPHPLRYISPSKVCAPLFSSSLGKPGTERCRSVLEIRSLASPLLPLSSFYAR